VITNTWACNKVFSYTTQVYQGYQKPLHFVAPPVQRTPNNAESSSRTVTREPTEHAIGRRPPEVPLFAQTLMHRRAGCSILFKTPEKMSSLLCFQQDDCPSKLPKRRHYVSSSSYLVRIAQLFFGAGMMGTSSPSLSMLIRRLSHHSFRAAGDGALIGLSALSRAACNRLSQSVRSRRRRA
jgi:hypothetical protein